MLQFGLIWSKEKQKRLGFLPLDRTNPPKSIKTSNANDPKTYAIIMFLAAPAMNRKREDAIWLAAKKSRYCLKSLQIGKLILANHKFITSIQMLLLRCRSFCWYVFFLFNEMKRKISCVFLKNNAEDRTKFKQVMLIWSNYPILLMIPSTPDLGIQKYDSASYFWL
jgi:hypothetical protein